MTSYQSRYLIVGRAFAATLLDALTTAPDDPLVQTGKIRLSKDPSYNPTPDSTRTALAANEADFSGYTGGGYAVTLSAAVRLGANIVGKVCNVLPVAATATPFVACQVYGYWMDDGANVIVAEKFPDGLVADFSAVGAYLDLCVAIALSLSLAAQ